MPDLPLLYTDPRFLVANKPPGIPTVPGGWPGTEGSLFTALEAELGRLWIVHRLDRGTSGLVLFARDAATHRALSLLFEGRSVDKVYHALCHGSPAWQAQSARMALLPDQGRRHRTIPDPARGVPAQTDFQVLERFAAGALLEARPQTGRTHQVRVHAAALGHPLLGDRLYGAPAGSRIDRPALHARALAFELDGHPYAFTAPYPPDFEAALARLRSGEGP